MASGINPTVDYVFKRLFGDEDNALLLVDLLNAVIGFLAGHVVRGVNILNPFVEKDYIDGKVSVFDVRARDDPGRQFLLEMQKLNHPALDKRLLFYWAGAHADQLFKGDRYEMLHGTFTLCFLKEPLIPDTAYHHRFRVYDDKNDVLLCKDLEIHLLELSKFDLPVEEVKTPLERWLYFLRHGASLELDKLNATLDVPVIRKAVEVLMKISQTERERQWAMERERAEFAARDLASWAQSAEEGLRAAEEARRAAEEARRAAEEARRTAEEEGRRARQQGVEEGIGKGELIGRVRFLQQMLQQAETPRDELAQRTEDELRRLEAALQQQFAGKKDANGAPPADKP